MARSLWNVVGTLFLREDTVKSVTMLIYLMLVFRVSTQNVVLFTRFCSCRSVACDFSTFVQQYLENGARYDQSYYWSLMGSWYRAFDWCKYQWPWMTLNGHYRGGIGSKELTHDPTRPGSNWPGDPMTRPDAISMNMQIQPVTMCVAFSWRTYISVTGIRDSIHRQRLPHGDLMTFSILFNYKNSSSPYFYFRSILPIQTWKMSHVTMFRPTTVDMSIRSASVFEICFFVVQLPAT